jgi:hypothetical protein
LLSAQGGHHDGRDLVVVAVVVLPLLLRECGRLVAMAGLGEVGKGRERQCETEKLEEKSRKHLSEQQVSRAASKSLW